ncbi:uncharacterized protein LOC128610270 isoform X5 [Ictalurus furcatus]|uniref:uncharacterized protein LOC128610270 isoform X5 n=1 Tax=Ictalurus furcatus TaxID=66913 RepID=UPI00234FF541|nr:uncharacterized protein LOC128610270 isoform X5 [Ictalurus furcatus]XP_053485473.1 uncharacterized protein LOC128610270 isoform X5 [Ictalurus furcatus]XP_053485474.1 uncharacterized protein LOC128610270 isoform X5 [Ictalurus furcatus]
MLGRCSDLNHAAKEGGNQQNDAFSQDKYKSTTAQVQNTEVSAADWVTLRRRTLIGAVTVSALIILALLGGIVITAHRLMEVLDQLNTAQTCEEKERLLSHTECTVGLLATSLCQMLLRSFQVCQEKKGLFQRKCGVGL